jgi:dienelactone hydrolase
MSSTTRRAHAVVALVGLCLVRPALRATAPTVAATGARLEVVPSRVLQGDPVSLHIRGLAPGAIATVHAQSTNAEDDRIRPFYGTATFMADADGNVDLATAAPVRGDYHRPDVRGLFWSQRPLEMASPDRTTTATLHLDEPASVGAGQVILTLEARGTIVDRKVLTFLPSDPASAREDVRSDALIGAFYYKKGAQKRPAIVVVGGSEGGLDVADWIGPKLASRGFVVFGLNYFSPPENAVAGVPTTLKRIPIELLEKVRTWLGRRPEVDVKRIGMIGYSKGAELTLVVASTYDWIRVAVAYAPSDVVWQGIPSGDDSASSWSYQGRELPFLPTTGMRDAIAKGRQEGKVVIARVLQASIDTASPEALTAAAIPVERSRAALLLIGGGDDQLGDSGACVIRLAARLKRAAYTHPKETLLYPAAGHVLIGTGWRPTTTDNADVFQDGGTPEADALAQAESWTKMLAFLGRHLRR